MFRILKDETIKKYGYDPATLVPWSHKPVVVACKTCGHVYPNKMLRAVTDSKTKFCRRCAPPQKQRHHKPDDPNRIYPGKGPAVEKCRLCKKEGCLYVNGLCPTCATAEARYLQRMGHANFSGFLEAS